MFKKWFRTKMEENANEREFRRFVDMIHEKLKDPHTQLELDSTDWHRFHKWMASGGMRRLSRAEAEVDIQQLKEIPRIALEYLEQLIREDE